MEAGAALARDKRITARNDLFAGRRPDAYGPIPEGAERWRSICLAAPAPKKQKAPA